MATLIPAIGSCVSRMTSGEKWFANRLEDKLEDDYRAEHLAKVFPRPILILCYKKTLATKLAQTMEMKGLQDKVNVVNFHAWCVRDLSTYNVSTPPSGKDAFAFFEARVDKVIRSVDQKLIPSEQYGAVLIDEDHDFKPEWIKLMVQMIHPDTNSLLVLYDDAIKTDCHIC